MTKITAYDLRYFEPCRHWETLRMLLEEYVIQNEMDWKLIEPLYSDYIKESFEMGKTPMTMCKHIKVREKNGTEFHREKRGYRTNRFTALC